MRFFSDGSDIAGPVLREFVSSGGREIDMTRFMGPTHCPVCGQRLAMFSPGAPTMRCHVAGTNWVYEHALPPVEIEGGDV